MGKEIKNDGIIVKVTVMESAFIEGKENVKVSMATDNYKADIWVNKNQLNKDGCWTGTYVFGPNDDLPPKPTNGN